MILNTLLRETLTDYLGELFENGKLEIYKGIQSDSDDLPDSNDLLVSIDLQYICFNASNNGEITIAGIWFGTVDQNGTASWFRLRNVDNDIAITGSISLEGNGGDMILDDLDLIENGVIKVNDFTIALPNEI